MIPVYKEARFPVYYREAEVRQIMYALSIFRSISITGLAGMGKSNVVRFIVSHPQVPLQYLKEKAEDYAFVHVDCASLANTDENEILGEIVTQLRLSGISNGGIHQPTILRRSRDVLREKIRNMDANLNLVVAFDYFDKAATLLGEPFFNYLRHLRDIRPLANLSVVFATRKPLPNTYEFRELLVEPCAVGPLSHKDALDSIRRDETRIGRSFDGAQRDKLIACTGGHPGFLKNASELLGRGRLLSDLPMESLSEQLLGHYQIRNLCEELWSDLTPTEQGVVLSVARGGTFPEAVDGESLAYLERIGVLAAKKDGLGRMTTAVFCPLFETFLRNSQSRVSKVRVIAVPPRQARVETATDEERIALGDKVFDLLMAFAQARGQALSKEELICEVYGEHAVEECYGALAALVGHLRRKLNPCIRRMLNEPKYDCVENVFGYGYRFRPE